MLRGGASLVGAVVAGSLAEQLLAATALRASADTTTHTSLEPEFPGRLLDELSSIVADLEKKFPYASALYASQGGISISRDRKGKRVSESGFPSRGVSLRVFDGSTFHDAAVGTGDVSAIRAAARRLSKDVSLEIGRAHV